MPREQPKKWQKDKKQKNKFRIKYRCDKGASLVAQLVKNPISIHEDVGSIPGPAQWVKDPVLLPAAAMLVTDEARPALLWLWCRPQLQLGFHP